MQSCARRQAQVLGRQARATAARPAKSQAKVRCQSTSAFGNADRSHAVAGLAGGAAVVVLGYTWYHVSGTKKVISSARESINTLSMAKDKISEATPSPGAALSLLRHLARSYASAIPGAGSLVDASFDSLEKIVNENSEKAKEILDEAYSEFQQLVKDPSKDAGQKLTELLAKVGQQIQELGQRADDDFITPFIEKNPQLKQALAGSQQHIQDLLSKHGPDAQKLKDDTLKQLTAIAAAGFSADGISKAVKLVKEQSSKAKGIAESTGEDAYKKLSENAEPLLKKIPDLKKLLDEQLPQLAPIIGDKGAEDVKKMYAQLEELGKSAKNKDAATLAKEAKQIVLENLSKLQQAGTQAKDKAVGKTAGLLDLGALPELSNFKSAIEKQGPEAHKLAESTMAEVKEVLARKMQEAKRIADKAKNETQK